MIHIKHIAHSVWSHYRLPPWCTIFRSHLTCNMKNFWWCIMLKLFHTKVVLRRWSQVYIYLNVIIFEERFQIWYLVEVKGSPHGHHWIISLQEKSRMCLIVANHYVWELWCWLSLMLWQKFPFLFRYFICWCEGNIFFKIHTENSW